MTAKQVIADFLIQVLQLVMMSAILAFVVSIYYQRSETRYVVGETCEGQPTFLKMLILKPDLDLDVAKQIARVVDEASGDFDRDADFILSIISVESKFNPSAVSSVGAQGLMQVMPLWLKVMGAEGEDLFDPRINVRRGLQVYNSYEQMLKKTELALTAYNRGSWKVEEDLRKEVDPRNGYAKEVLDVYDKLKRMR